MKDSTETVAASLERALTADERKALLVRANEITVSLHDEHNEFIEGLRKAKEAPTHDSWLNGAVPSEEVSDQCRFFDRFGFLHMKGFSGALFCGRSFTSFSLCLQQRAVLRSITPHTLGSAVFVGSFQCQ